jgi:hypothetical protein
LTSTGGSSHIRILEDTLRVLAEAHGGIDRLLVPGVPVPDRRIVAAAVQRSEWRADAIARAEAEGVAS